MSNNILMGRMWIVKLPLYLVFMYAALLIFMYFMQRRMIYYPDRITPMRSYIHALGLQYWPSEGQVHRGFISTKQKTGSAGTVVVFHGNAGSARDRIYYMQVLEPLGYRVVLAEYPGYGGRSGRLSEKEFLADSKITVRQAYEMYGPPFFLCGESLGCGVTTGLAENSPVPIEGMVLITPWDSLPNLAQSICWFLPARWFVFDKYDNINNLKGFAGKVALALAEHDEIIPKKHGMKLYEALSCEKRMWVWKGAGHNSWPGIIDVSWWKEVMGYLAKDDTIEKFN